MGTVYAIANQKGGVGKTTTAVNTSAAVAEAGYPTLLVDLDPQCNATLALGFSRSEQPNVYEVPRVRRRSRRPPSPRPSPGLSLVPSNPDLAGANMELPRLAGSEKRLRDALGEVRERHFFTLLDCPPSLGPLTVNALVAADKVIVPVQTEYFALEGLAGPARHAPADPARAQPAPQGGGHDPDDARRPHQAGAGRRARGARALPGTRLRHRHPPQRAARRGAQLRCPGHPPRPRCAGSIAYLKLAKEVAARG